MAFKRPPEAALFGRERRRDLRSHLLLTGTLKPLHSGTSSGHPPSRSHNGPQRRPQPQGANCRSPPPGSPPNLGSFRSLTASLASGFPPTPAFKMQQPGISSGKDQFAQLEHHHERPGVRLPSRARPRDPAQQRKAGEVTQLGLPAPGPHRG